MLLGITKLSEVTGMTKYTIRNFIANFTIESQGKEGKNHLYGERTIYQLLAIKKLMRLGIEKNYIKIILDIKTTERRLGKEIFDFHLYFSDSNVFLYDEKENFDDLIYAFFSIEDEFKQITKKEELWAKN